MIDYPCGNSRNQVLIAFAPADLTAMLPFIEEVDLTAGTLIYEHGDQVKFVYFPHDAVISILAVFSGGESVETCTVGCDGALGTATGFGRRKALMNARVQVSGSAARIASSRFEAIASQSDDMKHIIIRVKELMLAQVQQNAACSALHSVEQRLARVLLQTQDRTLGAALPFTQEMLAQTLGVRRATITNALQTFREAGAIDHRRGEIEVIGRRALERIVCECYSSIRNYLDDFMLASVR